MLNQSDELSRTRGGCNACANSGEKEESMPSIASASLLCGEREEEGQGSELIGGGFQLISRKRFSKNMEALKDTK